MSDIGPYSNYRLTARLELKNRPGVFASVISLFARLHANLGAVDLVEATGKITTRDITFDVANEAHGKRVVAALRRLKTVYIVSVSDRIFLAHLGGKLRVENKFPITTRNRLSMVYTPGVARVSEEIAAHPNAVHALTIKRNSVAVVSDGSAVLGLGNLGPYAALPVMEGKAMIFKEFANIDAWPICLSTQNVDEIVRTVEAIAPGFGGINLEDISAPRCFEIEERLRESLDIPVMHDDQHGTSIVVLAALQNALRVIRKDLKSVNIVVSGMGAAGVACCQILLAAGARHLIGCGRKGIIFDSKRTPLTQLKHNIRRFIDRSNPGPSLKKALGGADVFIGLSQGNILEARDLRKMKSSRIVFAMANPDPEIDPMKALKLCRVFATGRSDFPNQINNALAFPGIFRGALNVHARCINEPMKLAAARSLAHLIKPDQLNPEYIIPSIFDRHVVEAIAKSVAEAAISTGVARKSHHSS